MSTNNEQAFDDIKCINPRDKYVVHGYIKSMQTLLPWKRSAYYTIPRLVDYLCLLYYSMRGSFNTEHCAKDLHFIDHKTVQKLNIGRPSVHSVCTFGGTINKSMCNIFRIEFLIKDARETWCPYFTLLSASSVPAMNHFIDDIPWETYYLDATKTLLKYSVCLHNKTASESLQWQGSKPIGRAGLTFAIGDRIMLEHNFADKRCNVYFNDEQSFDFEIKEECILPMLSMYFEGETVEVTQYQFES
eukprot:421360_1